MNNGKRVYGLTRNQFARVVMKSALDNACSTMFIRQWLDWFEQQPDDAGAFGRFRNEKKIMTYTLGMIRAAFNQVRKETGKDEISIEHIGLVLEGLQPDLIDDDNIQNIVDSDATAEEILSRI
jgi:hypothetical protein